MLGLSQHLYVDSDYRVSGTSSNFQYNIRLNQSIPIDHVALISATLPKTYYLVSSGTNSFTLAEDAKTTTITIPPGNYGMSSFKTVLQALLRTRSPNGWTYTVTQPNTISAASTGKYTYTVTGNTSQPSFIFSSTCKLHKQLGFEKSSTNVFVAGTLTSANVVDFNTIKGMFIKSNIIENSSNNNVHGNAILQEIFNFNVTDFSNIGYQNNQILYSAKRLKSSIGATISFAITDVDDLPVDFNGSPVNLSLVFFKLDRYHEAAIHDIKMKWFSDIQDEKKDSYLKQ